MGCHRPSGGAGSSRGPRHSSGDDPGRSPERVLIAWRRLRPCSIGVTTNWSSMSRAMNRLSNPGNHRPYRGTARDQRCCNCDRCPPHCRPRISSTPMSSRSSAAGMAMRFIFSCPIPYARDHFAGKAVARPCPVIFLPFATLASMLIGQVFCVPTPVLNRLPPSASNAWNNFGLSGTDSGFRSWWRTVQFQGLIPRKTQFACANSFEQRV